MIRVTAKKRNQTFAENIQDWKVTVSKERFIIERSVLCHRNQKKNKHKNKYKETWWARDWRKKKGYKRKLSDKERKKTFRLEEKSIEIMKNKTGKKSKKKENIKRGGKEGINGQK